LKNSIRQIKASFTSKDSIFILFVGLALTARIGFWAYTNRTFEDALITLAPIKNFWLGNGLTHHVTEPRVHSFTSVLSILMPLPWEGLGMGLISMKIYSLAASVASLMATRSIFNTLKVSKVPRILGYSFISLDQGQIFFGMSGMETQIAVAILLTAYSYLLKEQWVRYGWCLGIGLLARPDFVIYMIIGYVSYIACHKSLSLRFTIGTLLLPLLWVAAATAYFGSPIPNTIVAKSLIHDPYTLSNSLSSLVGYWKSFSPYWANYFTINAPIAKWQALIITLIIFCTAIYGLRFKYNQGKKLTLIPAAGVFIYIIYLSFFQVSKYYLWYVQPVSAVLFIYCSIGFDAIIRLRIMPNLPLNFCIILLSFVYAIHIPNSFAIEKEFQDKVESVRAEVGRYLDAHAAFNDVIILEPLGYTGINAFNKTIYDFPGLSSRASVAALRSLKPSERNFANFIQRIQPKYIALRPQEVYAFKNAHPNSAFDYTLLKVIKSDTSPNLSSGRLTYHQDDSEFHIYKKIN